MTEENKTQKAENVELNISSVSWDDNIKKLTFKTNVGNITWKPKKKVTENFRGMVSEKSVTIEKEDLPNKVFDLINIINQNGYVEVIGSYLFFEKEVDNKVNQYRYLVGDKLFEEWAIKTKEVGEGSN